MSASPKRNTKPPSRFPYLALILVVAVAALAVATVSLPASTLNRFLTPPLHAEDFSGSLWHGAAGKILIDTRAVGAVEWHIHPWSLLTLSLLADVHWVKTGFVADGNILAKRNTLTARNVTGGGPIEDLADLGVAAGWHGTARGKISELKIGFAGTQEKRDAVTLQSVVGDINVSDLSSPQIAGGSSLGGYALHIANGAITPDADATAELTDTGGPLELSAILHFSAKDHTGLLTGTVRERAAASAALRSQLETLTQMHARDAQGRIPVELEFTL